MQLKKEGLKITASQTADLIATKRFRVEENILTALKGILQQMKKRYWEL